MKCANLNIELNKKIMYGGYDNDKNYYAWL